MPLSEGEERIWRSSVDDMKGGHETPDDTRLRLGIDDDDTIRSIEDYWRLCDVNAGGGRVVNTLEQQEDLISFGRLAEDAEDTSAFLRDHIAYEDTGADRFAALTFPVSEEGSEYEQS